MGSVAKQALAPFERQGPGPYQVQHELQDMMQNLVGIVRHEDEMQQALYEIAKLIEQTRHVCIYGNREYNGGWHTALDLPNLLTVSEAITRSAIERKESRGAHFRDDFPDKSEEGANSTSSSGGTRMERCRSSASLCPR